MLTTQCSQLDEANHAWQAYQQAQLDALRTKLIEYVPLEENSSLDAIGQQIVHELTQEREDFNGRSQAILRANDELETTKQSYMTSVDQLNRELVEMKEAYDQLFTQNQNLLDELQKQSIAAAQSQMKPTTGRLLFDTLDLISLFVYYRASGIVKYLGARFRSGVSLTSLFSRVY